jgi:hypothetical protein
MPCVSGRALIARALALDLVLRHDPQLADHGIAWARDHAGHSVGGVLGRERFDRGVERVDLRPHRRAVVRAEFGRDGAGL